MQVERQLYRSVRLNQTCTVLNGEVINLSGITSLANCQITLGCTDLTVPADTDSDAATYINLDAVANCQEVRLQCKERLKHNIANSCLFLILAFMPGILCAFETIDPAVTFLMLRKATEPQVQPVFSALYVIRSWLFFAAMKLII